MSASPASRHRRGRIARRPSRLGRNVLASVALAANALTLERSPQLIVPAKDIVAVKRSLLPAPAIVRASNLDGLTLASFLPGMNPGFMFGSAAAPAATVVFKTRGRDATNLSQYNFTDVDVEATTTNKTVIVAFNYGSGSIGSVDFVTIEGVSATLLSSITNGNQGLAMFAAACTTATADITIDLQNTENRLQYAIWVAYNLQSLTPVDTALISPEATSNLSTTAGGIAIGYGMVRANSSFTWTGLTEDFDVTATFDGGGMTDSGASAQTPTTTVNGLTVLPDAASTSEYNAIVVTLR
jgi:hypothetical protein